MAILSLLRKFAPNITEHNNHKPLQMLYWALNGVMAVEDILHDNRWNTIKEENKQQQLRVSIVNSVPIKIVIMGTVCLCMHVCVCACARACVHAWGTA